MRLIRYLSISFLGVFPLLAEDAAGPLSGPVLGYVNKSALLRPLIGIPGAAYFGSVVDLQGLELAAISSESGYAVVWTADRTGVSIVTPGSGTQSLVNGANPTVDAIYLSPRGTAAALVHGSQVDIFLNLPEKPVSARTVEIPSHPIAVAVSDDGASLAVLEGNALTLFDVTGQKQLATLTTATDLRFRAGSHDLVYSDGSSVMLATAEGAALVVGAADGVSSPRAALYSRDGRLLIIADAANNDLILLQPQSGESERVKLPCTPAGLALMNDSTLRLQCETGDRIHLIQITPSGTRVLFVPEPVE